MDRLSPREEAAGPQDRLLPGHNLLINPRKRLALGQTSPGAEASLITGIRMGGP